MTQKSKFETLIEFVINDEEDKAKELFHDIVVEKSREIYESLMEEDEVVDEGEDCGDDTEELDETFGGDASDDLIADVEAEEQGMQEEEEFDSEEDSFGSEESSDDSIEDRVVDLEDKLDELMAEFEAIMGDEGSSEEEIDLDAGEGGDALEMDDTAEFSDEPVAMEEGVNLSAAPKPVTAEPAGTNTKSINANNSGAKGAVASPVKMTGDTAQGRPAPKTGELIGKVQNSVGGNKTLSAAPKPVTTQASGVNTKTPFPKA